MAITVHMCRVFFTGAFRKPREINWVIGTILSMLALIEGFAGYSLPDDLLSGTGLRAAEGFMQSDPGHRSPTCRTSSSAARSRARRSSRACSRVHVLLLPAIIVGLFTAHIVLVFVHKHTQYPGPGRTNKNVVGYPFMPVYTAKAGGFFFIVFGVIALISALVTINPIWAYGPYDPSPVTAGSQPDWYMGFADGALRLLPGWLEFRRSGFTLSFNVFIGAILLIPVMYGLIGIYPFLETWVTGDKREHHLLDRPRNAPTRTGIGMAGITTYAVLFFAAGNDLIAIKLRLSINDITYFLRAAFFVAPPLAFWVTKRICLSLQRRDRDMVLHGRETGTDHPHRRGTVLREARAARRVRALAPGAARAAPSRCSSGRRDENGVASRTARKERMRAQAVALLLQGPRRAGHPGRAGGCAPPRGPAPEAIEHQEPGGAPLVEMASSGGRGQPRLDGHEPPPRLTPVTHRVSERPQTGMPRRHGRGILAVLLEEGDRIRWRRAARRAGPGPLGARGRSRGPWCGCAPPSPAARRSCGPPAPPPRPR